MAQMKKEIISPQKLRRFILEQSKRANVGHIGSALSIVEIMAVHYGKILHFSESDPLTADRFILSKGHAVLAQYSTFYELGWLSQEMLNSYCGDDTLLGLAGAFESGSREALPPVYRQCAVAYTDFWSAYQAVLPSKRHRPVDKESGKTNHIERFNSTLQQRISRLGRKTLSFSQKLQNHIGAIWLFIHHYNQSLP